MSWHYLDKWPGADLACSSTKIRLFRKRGMSIRYLIPDKVVDYIYENDLYLDDDKSKSEKGKEKMAGPDMTSTS